MCKWHGAPTLALKPIGRVNQNPKQRVQEAPQMVTSHGKKKLTRQSNCYSYHSAEIDQTSHLGLSWLINEYLNDKEPQLEAIC